MLNFITDGLGVRRATIAAALLLAGCEGTVSVNLATEASAEVNIEQVRANLSGLQFLKGDGGTESLDFSSSEPVDLTDYLDGNTVRLFTDEELPEGTYTGVRLTFDSQEDATVVRTDGTEFPITLADGDYADVDFKVDDNDTSHESLILTLDLRQSLSFDEDIDEYTLEPVLRSVRTRDAAEITGAVTVDCPSGSSLTDGGAVYVFEGEDIVPDDRDADTAPFATTRVLVDSLTGLFSYTLRFLPEGDYTVALTCIGDEEDPATDDDLQFRSIENVRLRAGESLTHDIT